MHPCQIRSKGLPVNLGIEIHLRVPFSVKLVAQELSRRCATADRYCPSPKICQRPEAAWSESIRYASTSNSTSQQSTQTLEQSVQACVQSITTSRSSFVLQYLTASRFFSCNIFSQKCCTWLVSAHIYS